MGLWKDPETGETYEVLQDRRLGEVMEGAFLQKDRVKMVEDIIHEIELALTLTLTLTLNDGGHRP